MFNKEAYIPCKHKFSNLIKFATRLIFFPLRLLLITTNFISKILSKSLKEERIDKIRPPRYINKSSSKIDNYSESRALAYQNLIKNKKKLNIFEDIEHYFNLADESIILTNLRLIYVENNKNTTTVKFIELESIFYIDDSNPGIKLKLFYFDENYTKFEINENNLNNENYFFKYKFTRKNHLSLKIFEICSKGSNKDFQKLIKIYDLLREKYPYKLTKCI